MGPRPPGPLGRWGGCKKALVNIVWEKGTCIYDIKYILGIYGTKNTIRSKKTVGNDLDYCFAELFCH